MAYPIPPDALDDRLAFVGTSGSGKTYNAGTAVERLLKSKARVGIVDPLSAWWGLRLAKDGKRPSGFDVVIFGGAHADLPLTESAGALIGETCAQMAESFILDLSGLGTKASERRFMLAFLTALYRKTSGEPLHVVIDEADMWAPQMLSDRDGDAAKLLGMMETIVRRGRIKGFVPWLITQRPAVLSKNVLSQADGLIAMKLTSSQDRGALGDWIEGQADRAEGKRILATMPTLQRGEGVVWIPGRGVLATAVFPEKATFDSSRTPARGEVKRAVSLKPLDLDALKTRLATIEADVKANDPKALKARIVELEREAKKKPAPAPAASDAAALKAARDEGFAAGVEHSWEEAHQAGRDEGFNDAIAAAQSALGNVERKAIAAKPAPRPQIAAPHKTVAPADRKPAPAHKAPAPAHNPAASGDITKPQMKVLEALAFWDEIGFETPTRIQVGAAAGYSPTSGGFGNLLSQLKVAGLIDYPAAGLIALTTEGSRQAPHPETRSPRDRLGDILSAPQQKLVDALANGAPWTREDLGNATGYSPSSGGFGNLLSSLKSIGVIDYPAKGLVRLASWVFG